jgi:hypothetical protein
VAIGIDHEIADHQRVVVGDRARAPQDGPDAGQQLLQVERLGHVVVAAEPESVDLVGPGVAGGQEEYRHRAGPPAGPGQAAQAAQDLEAVQVGQHDVEQHQVGRLPQGLR